MGGVWQGRQWDPGGPPEVHGQDPKVGRFKGADHSTGIVEIRGNAGIGIRGIRIFQYLNQCPELHDEEGNIIPLSERFSGAAPLFRGDGFYIKFEGLQRIYAS